MRLTLFLALRFLLKSARVKQVGLFTLVSVLGVAVSVFVFFFIDTIIHGLSTHLQSSLMGFEAPLFLSYDDNDQDKTLKKFAQTHQKFGITYYLTYQFDGLIQRPGQASFGARIKSADKEFFKEKKDKIEIFFFDDYTLEDYLKADDLILIGESVYANLLFLPGDEEVVFVTHPFADIGPTGEMEPVQKQFVIAGFFYTGRLDFDESFVLIPSKNMLSMASIDFLTKEYYVFAKTSQFNLIKNEWAKNGFKQQLVTVYDRNQNLFQAMQLEKLMYFIIFVFVLIIACFNLAALIMIFGVSKADALSVLKTLGVQLTQLHQIFVTIGVMLGAIGSFAGVFIAVILIVIAQKSGFSLPEAYGFTELPLAINIKTIVSLLVGTPVFTGFIAFLVAHKIVNRNVVMIIK